MSIEGSGPVSRWGALRSYGYDAIRAGIVRVPGRNDSHHDAAFRRYQRDFRQVMKSDAAEFTVLQTRPVAVGETNQVIELRFATSATVNPGDMLLLDWQNSPQQVARFHPGDRELRYFTTPQPHLPAKHARASETEVLTRVLDLSGTTSASLSTTDRILPRIYTVSGAVPGGSGQPNEVSIQVTLEDSWPQRASAYLGRLEAGDIVRGRVLPHPHRIDRTVPTLAIVTGSGAAGVFAALRAGCAPIEFVWGLGDKELEPWVFQELARFREAGVLGRVDFARRPDRVTDILRPMIQAPRSIYVSGNEDMGVAVDWMLRESWGDSTVEALQNDMTYIASW